MSEEPRMLRNGARNHTDAVGHGSGVLLSCGRCGMGFRLQLSGPARVKRDEKPVPRPVRGGNDGCQNSTL
ncbi:hypothetical protein FHX37_1482 [Haloactinospora alba]|uniref:Uncharacterized protein n=1 Tax=Haloactinospora alba TaxID=405555 RepID=A0A543NIJ2_9ACTN|nr:hypothetical protein FHX37_1482 [Haloactinospora alba]